MPYFEAVIRFFLLDAIVGFARSDLKIPGVLYESLSIFLLLAIGLKGGVELARYPLLDVALPALAVVAAAARRLIFRENPCRRRATIGRP